MPRASGDIIDLKTVRDSKRRSLGPFLAKGSVEALARDAIGQVARGTNQLNSVASSDAVQCNV